MTSEWLFNSHLPARVLQQNHPRKSGGHVRGSHRVVTAVTVLALTRCHRPRLAKKITEWEAQRD